MPMSMSSQNTPPRLLPPDDAQRRVLHDEVHARPSSTITLPALVVSVALLNEDTRREQELEHLRRLPGQAGLAASDLKGNYCVLLLPQGQLSWERHTEFTRYVWCQPLPAQAGLGAVDPDLLPDLGLPAGWLAELPGRTLAAIKLVMLHADLCDAHAALDQARTWFGERQVVASLMGNPAVLQPAGSAAGAAAAQPGPPASAERGHSCVVTDFRLRDTGFERMLVLAPPGTSPTRAGRISQRLLELEIYRLVALRGLPVAKSLSPMLAACEADLAQITAELEDRAVSDQALLDRLTALAVRVERSTAEHGYRFSATQAYHAIVKQRIAELREKPISGTQTVGEFMQRRLSPAMATVDSTANRLHSLSQRIERAGALLRTRVDIATEAQNHQLLAKLTRGQELQLKLQSTVEGLSIAAISYYVISLLLYAAKAAQRAGLPLQPEIAAGAAVPLVLWGVWRTVRRIHDKLQKIS
ncbi:MAG: DUF3422 domain-containing protein [Rubrivivax sp.]|nr:DUF3422 domain-containing protein [Rubrivivax sp.]